jgi:hypothetical protein
MIAIIQMHQSGDVLNINSKIRLKEISKIQKIQFQFLNHNEVTFVKYKMVKWNDSKHMQICVSSVYHNDNRNTTIDSSLLGFIQYSLQPLSIEKRNKMTSTKGFFMKITIS